LYENYKKLKEDIYLNNGGKTFWLITDSLGSVQKNSPLIYKGIKVGKVLSFKLNKQSGQVDVKVYVSKEYSDQVNESTIFFHRSGVEVKATLDGIKIQTGSVEAIIRGGIAFKTPLKGEKVNSNKPFTLYKDEDTADNKYVEISFIMKEESGLKEGSAIVYKSINVGQVKELKLVDDEIVIKALIDEEHKNLLAQDSIFWVEDISIGIDSVENPSAIISGAFIKVQKGNSVTQANKFSLSNTNPVATLNQEGLRVLVTGKKLGSLSIGSPIFYRQIKIGSVEGVRLSDNAKGVELKLFITKCYAYLVRKNSLFYNAGAIGVDVSLLGVKIKTETVATMINGGINIVTPDDAQEKALANQKFKLFSDPEDDWLEYEPELINDDMSCKKAS
jgi:paraquat-inducible protein B